jgi:hypothetical protein
LFYEPQDGASQFGLFILNAHEKVLLPLHQREGVHNIDSLPPFIFFSFHPMSIQICKEAIDVISAGSVSIPFSGIIAQ